MIYELRFKKEKGSEMTKTPFRTVKDASEAWLRHAERARDVLVAAPPLKGGRGEGF